MVCVKLSLDQAGWHREWYFGEIFHGHPGVLSLLDSFVVVPKGRGDLLYALVTELAKGTVADLFDSEDLPWTERTVRTRMGPIIDAMALLHEQGGLHRDVTPWNVFVTADNKLKLGDFGIAVHGRPREGVPAEVFNPGFVPRKIARDAVKRWTAGTDLFQLANVAALLLDDPDRRADVSPMDSGDLRKIGCSTELKAVLYRALQPHQFPYRSAAEFAESMAHLPRFPRGRLRTVRGKRMVLTGPMTHLRSDLHAAIRAAGGQPQDDVNASTDYVVVGSLSPTYVAESAGRKLLDALAAGSHGCKVKVVTEGQLLACLAG